MKVIKKLLTIFVVLISIFSILFHIRSHIKYRSQQAGDTQTTVLIQKVPFLPSQNYKKLLLKNKTDFTFKAKYNNLGKIYIKFDNYQKKSTDTLWFRIKEVDSSDWYFQNKYPTNRFNNGFYTEFEFPPIVNSQGKEYTFEFESISGTGKNSVSINNNSLYFIVKYPYSLDYFKQSPSQIIPFSINKITALLSYFDKFDYKSIFMSSIGPVLLCLILIISPPKKLFVNNIIHLNKLFIKITNHPNFHRFFKFAFPSAIFILTFIVSGYFSTIGADPHHDGILFKPALDVNHGSILFKDTFTQYGPLTTFIQVVAIKIFGEYLLTIKLLTAAFYAFISLTLYFIFIKFIPKFVAFFSLIIWLLIAPYYSMAFLSWSSVYALLFQLIASLILLNATKNKSSNLYFWAGLFTSLVFWSRQSVGIFMFFAVCAYLIYQFSIKGIKEKEFKFSISKYLIGNLIISLFFLIYIIGNHALTDWLKQSFIFAYNWGKMFGISYSLERIITCLFPFSISPLSIWIIIPVSSILLFISNYKNKAISLLFFIGMASWLQYFPQTTLRHFYWAATPMLPLLAIFIYQFINEYLLKNFCISKSVLSLLVALGMWIIFAPDIAFRINQAFTKINTPYYFIKEPPVLNGIRLTKIEADFYKNIYLEIEKYFDKNPQGNVINTTPDSLYLTFDKRIKNIYSLYVTWPNLTDYIYPNYQKQLNDYIKTNKPLLISSADLIPANYCKVNNISSPDTLSSNIIFLAKACP